MLVFLGKYLSLDCPASKPVLFGLYRSDPTACHGRFAVYPCVRGCKLSQWKLSCRTIAAPEKLLC